jgi:hypothetical protein
MRDSHCHSAVLTGYIPIGIRSSHTDMTKFRDIEDPGFVAAASQLRRWIKESVRAERGSLSHSAISTLQENAASGVVREGPLEVPCVTHIGSHFNGLTTVSGGSVFQGNFTGRIDGTPWCEAYQMSDTTVR